MGEGNICVTFISEERLSTQEAHWHSVHMDGRPKLAVGGGALILGYFVGCSSVRSLPSWNFSFLGSPVHFLQRLHASSPVVTARSAACSTSAFEGLGALAFCSHASARSWGSWFASRRLASRPPSPAGASTV